MITMSEQMVPLAVVQRINFKFITNGNVKPAEIHMRHHNSVMRCCQGPRCMTGLSHVKKARQRTRIINSAYYSKFLKDQVKPAFHSKRRGRSVKSVSLLHDNVGLHTAAVSTGTLQEMHWEVLPHPACSPDLGPSNCHLFSPFKKALGEKRPEPILKLNFLCKGGWTIN